MSIFLTEAGTRHALLVKNKTFAEEEATRQTVDGKGGRAQPVMIREESDEENFQMRDVPSGEDEAADGIDAFHDDKKKLRFNTTYDGFNIWGFVLCLLVERKGGSSKKTSSDGSGAQVLMEEWISTQQAQNDES